MNRFDHRTVGKWQADCKKLAPLHIQNDLAHVEPLIPSRDGFVLTADDRLAFQFMLPSQAAKHDMDGINVTEAYALMARLENLPAIEAVAIEMQRDLVVLRKALVALHAAVSRGVMPSSKDIVTAAQAIRDTDLQT